MQDSCVVTGEAIQGEKYRKVKILGEGAMGRAYLVECMEEGKFYVMKRINLGHLEAKQRQASLREAQLHSVLSHPNIVAFKQVYQTTGDKLCIVMQYAEGGDLEEFLKNQNGKLMQQAAILQLFSQMCLGMLEVHDKRIVHRDLKAANIFMTKDKQIKIGDFGISRSLDRTQMAATSLIGTPYYLSPQMVEGKPYSTKADIWSLGVLLYQLCCYKLPFDANSLPVLALKIMKGSFPPLPSQFSTHLKTLVLQMLQVDQKKRPSIETILNKSFVFKLLPKEEQERLQSREKQRKELKQQKQKEKTLQQKVLKEEKEDRKRQEKERAKRERDEKRQEQRRQMRQDLKRRRAQKDEGYKSVQPTRPSQSSKNIKSIEANKSMKTNETSNKSYLTAPHSEQVIRKSPRKQLTDPLKKGPNRDAAESQNKRRDVAEKPWKVKRPSQKEQVTIEMYVPEHKPQSVQQIPPQTLEPEHEPEPSKEKSGSQSPQRKSLQLVEPVQNYHYRTQPLEQANESDHSSYMESDEASIEEEEDLQQLMSNIRDIENMAQNLPSPDKPIHLYQESDNFDNTVPLPEAPKPKPEDIENLSTLLNNETLEQLRLELEKRLGDNRFRQAYEVVKRHMEQYYQCIKGREEDRDNIKQSFMYNKELLMSKLPFLREVEFHKNIELLLTLIIYEEIEMHKNIDPYLPI